MGESYWFGYRNHILNNFGYGSFGDFNFGSSPEKVALGEAVGNYVGAIYGNTSSGGENFEFSIEDKFIPRGLMWDLVDDTPWDIVTDPNSEVSFFDNISGFTPQMIFDGLNGVLPIQEVQSIREFRDNLRTLHLNNTSNSASDFDAFLDGNDVFN